VLATRCRSSSRHHPRRSSSPERQAQGAGRHRPERAKALPDVRRSPRRCGLDITAWYGFMAARGTPRDIVKKIHDDSVPSSAGRISRRLDKDGIEPVANTPRSSARDQARPRALGDDRQAADAKLD